MTAVPIPPHLSEIMRERDTEKIALETFAEVGREHMNPEALPPRATFDKALLMRWQKGGSIPEDHKPAFAIWLDANRMRTLTLGENERKLRTTMWAQWRLRGTTYEPILAAFHRERWGIEQVEYESDAREQQVQARVRHGVV